jgi:ubiquinone/menaquinone biosynthesis C-methylase UbiE
MTADRPAARVRERERAFYDEHASGLDAAALEPRPPDAYEQAILSALGDVEGAAVLDAGCGEGDLTLELLRRGARVTALDVSPGMLGVTRARVELFRPGAEARFVAAPVEATGLADGEFDRVAGKWVLHHADVSSAARELARVLRPGGRAAFYENQALNPVLSAARRRLVAKGRVRSFGTPDERPLERADFEAVRSAFGALSVEYPSMYFFELLSRQLLRYRGHRRLQALDALVWRRAPRLRRFSYHVLLVASKP